MPDMSRSEIAKRNWANPSYRESMVAAAKAAWKNPNRSKNGLFGQNGKKGGKTVEEKYNLSSEQAKEYKFLRNKMRSSAEALRILREGAKCPG